MNNPLYGKDLLSIYDLNLEEILLVLKLAQHLKDKPQPNLLAGKIIGTCFYEASTRTRLSFTSAALRLGAQVIDLNEGSGQTSTKKGESLHDSIKIVGQYADLLVLRHPQEGSADLAAAATDVPVLNGGDGANQHPTQTLLDLFTIQQCQGRLDDLDLAFVGDLKYGRAARSLILACTHFNNRFHFVSPNALSVANDIREQLQSRGLKFNCYTDLTEVLSKVDILYMTRLQRERLTQEETNLSYQQSHLKLAQLVDVKPTMKILHPLPRVDEIELTIDDTPYAYYFQQAKNGLYIRQALFALYLLPTLEKVFHDSH